MNEKTYGIVKTWNAVKRTKYPLRYEGGDSAIVKRIDSLIAEHNEDKIEKYFCHYIYGEQYSNVNDIWSVADKWNVRRWLRDNYKEPIQDDVKPNEQETKGDEVKMENVLGLLSKEIVNIIGSDMAKQVADKVRAEMDAYISNKVICKVVEYNGQRNKIEGVTHECFDNVLKFVAMKEPVFLTGPAGSGKNVICEQVAKALGLDFYFSNAVTQEYKLTGYGDINGDFVETQFYKWAKNGGLFMLDEMDASVPEALIVLNCAIANGYFDFPVVGRVNLNENCRLIACGNTWGTGASMEYVGRNQLDGATLNRFAFVPIDYDRRIENALAGGNDNILALCRAFRKIANENGCHTIVSYREINRLHNMIDIAKMSVTDAIRFCLVKGIEKDSLRMIINKMSDGIEYRKNLLEIVNN